jgi:hypothetical protein
MLERSSRALDTGLLLDVPSTSELNRVKWSEAFETLKGWLHKCLGRRLSSDSSRF